MSDSEISQITVNYIYDLAYNIAQEFEKIVHLYGIDGVKPLVDKVIHALEILESNIQRIEQLEAELRDLKANNLHLSSEKIVNDLEKSKLKQTFEETEESWLQEVISLKTHISTLKTENELLKSHLSIQNQSSSKLEDASKSIIEDQENTIHQLRRALKQKEKLLQDNVFNISTLNARIQELLELNKILHCKNQEAKNDISKLIIEKNECKSKLILQKKENMLLSESINELVQSCINKQKDAESSLSCHSCCEHSSANKDDMEYYVQEEMKLRDKVKRLQSELQLAKLKSQQYEEKLNAPEYKKSLSKTTIHQFFHLFLGITTVSRFCWF